LCKLKYFFEIEIARSQEGIMVTQKKYALNIAAGTGLVGSNLVHTPMEQNHRLGLDTSDVL